jgi:hypothetical protein
MTEGPSVILVCAEKEGFEPSNGLPRCLISSQVPSTTQPLLHMYAAKAKRTCLRKIRVALGDYDFAETMGFEPMREVNPCLVSSEVPSTSSATSPSWTILTYFEVSF